jgi:hypothetical protein
LFRHVAALLLVLVPGAFAQAPDSVDAPAVDLGVESIVSGGVWKTSSAAGRFRAIGVSQGWEEVRHRVILEWIQDPDTNASDSIRARLDLNQALGLYGLVEPKLTRRGTLWYLSLRVARRPVSPYSETVVVELGPPGKVRRVRDR